MIVPKIDPEIVRLSKEMMRDKANREKKLARRQWWSANWIGLASLLAAIAAIVVTIILGIN